MALGAQLLKGESELGLPYKTGYRSPIGGAWKKNPPEVWAAFLATLAVSQSLKLAIGMEALQGKTYRLGEVVPQRALGKMLGDIGQCSRLAGYAWRCRSRLSPGVMHFLRGRRCPYSGIQRHCLTIGSLQQPNAAPAQTACIRLDDPKYRSGGDCSVKGITAQVKGAKGGLCS